VLYVCNVEEEDAATGNALSAQVFEKAEGARAPKAVVISAKIEASSWQLPPEERAEFLADDLGLEEPGLDRRDPRGLQAARAQTFFTVGPKEARAWTIPAGAKAPQAAGVIHTDFERGFIRAETIAYDDFVALGGERRRARPASCAQEGKEYRGAGRRRDA
jgi:ribosome-binding ATPase